MPRPAGRICCVLWVLGASLLFSAVSLHVPEAGVSCLLSRPAALTSTHCNYLNSKSLRKPYARAKNDLVGCDGHPSPFLTHWVQVVNTCSTVVCLSARAKMPRLFNLVAGPCRLARYGKQGRVIAG